jgi:hypothetical protein
MRDDRNRGVRLLRRLQLVLVVLLVVWFFSPPHVRSEVPLWLPFVLVLALEAQFVISSWRSSAPLVRPGDPTPGLADRERYGDGGLAEWAVVESDTGRVWVDISEPTEEEDEEEAVAAEPSRPRSLARALVEAAVALAAVTVLVLLLDRGNWNDLGPGARRAAESEFSVQASRVAGKPVRIECDTSAGGSRISRPSSVTRYNGSRPRERCSRSRRRRARSPCLLTRHGISVASPMRDGPSVLPCRAVSRSGSDSGSTRRRRDG